MSSNLKTLHANLETLVATTTGYTRLTHILDLDKNKFTPSSARFGVIPRGQQEVAGNTRNATIDYIFSIVICKSYITQASSDENIITTVLDISEKYDDIYKQAVSSKINATNIVINVSNFSLSEPVVIEKEKLIVIEGNFVIRCQYSVY